MVLGEIAARLGQASSVILLTHEIPDVDALASCAVLAETLSDQGRRALFLTNGPMGAEFDHLPGIQGLRALAAVRLPDDTSAWISPPGGRAVVVVLDTANLRQLGSAYQQNAEQLSTLPIICIDHHWSNTRFGTVNLVEHTTSSTCELVMALLAAMGRKPTASMAEALLSGIVVDTSRFSTTSVTPGTLRNAASLMEQGASLVDILTRTREPANGQRANLWQTLASRIT